MNKTTHLVIGSNSFLGRQLCEQLKNDKVEVTGVYHKNKSNLLTTIPQLQIDTIFNGNYNFNVVYIISAFVPDINGIKEDNKILLQTVNIDLVSKICKQFSKSRIVFCSSVSVYKSTSLKITEETLAQPETPYGISKLKAEAIVKQQKCYAIVRISSMFGPLMKTNTFLPAIINSGIKNREITLFGKGERIQNYIPVNLVANYLYNAGISEVNTIFLATYKKSFSNKELALKVIDHLIGIALVFKGEDHSNSYIYDNSKTNNQLNFTPKADFNKALNELIVWMKNES